MDPDGRLRETLWRLTQTRRVIEDTGWVTATVGSGWSNVSGNGAAYRKIGSVVYVRGFVSATSATPSSVIFTLPPGWRPSKDIELPCTQTPTFQATGVFIDTSNGNVTVLNFTSAFPAASGVRMCFNYAIDNIQNTSRRNLAAEMEAAVLELHA